MTGIYALIRPDGRLEFRDGVPDRMREDADPHHGVPAAFLIQRTASGGNGLHGQVAGTLHHAPSRGRARPSRMLQAKHPAHLRPAVPSAGGAGDTPGSPVRCEHWAIVVYWLLAVTGRTRLPGDQAVVLPRG